MLLIKNPMSPSFTANGRFWTITAHRLVLCIGRHWLLILHVFIGIYIGLPWLAPLFMEWGWERTGQTLYLLYSTQCHQLPQRSFFLFGPKPMYALSEIQAAWQNTSNPIVLRQFIGNSEMGWKVAWSDRMVSMYTSLFIWGALFGLLRQRLKPLPNWGLVLLLLPMVVDGGTHLVSDYIAGFSTGFRDTNIWLAVLTNYIFSPTFYAGDTLGSFNSWARLISGILFGLGGVWFTYPRIEAAFIDTAYQSATKFQKAGVPL